LAGTGKKSGPATKGGSTTGEASAAGLSATPVVAPVCKLYALAMLKTDIDGFANADTKEGIIGEGTVGLPYSKGLATLAPAVKKVFLELDGNGGMPAKVYRKQDDLRS